MTDGLKYFIAGLCLSTATAGCVGTQPPATADSRADQPLSPLLTATWREWPIETTTTALQGTPGAPAIHTQRAFGGTGADTAYDVWPLTDGGYAITGSTTSHEHADHDLFVVHLDAEGNIVWSRLFGGSGVEIGFAVRTLSDDTLVVAGWTHSFGAGAGDFLLLGIDTDGALKFARTYGGAGEERGVSLTVTPGDELLLIGETYSHGDGDARFLLIGTDATGRQQFERTYDGNALNDRGLAIVADDETVLLVGNAMDATSGSRATVSDGLAFAVDRRSGEPRWQLRLDSGEHDIFHHAAPLAHGGYLISGYTRGFGARGVNDILVLPVDANGNRGEVQLIGGDGADHNIIARADHNGGVVLAGYSTSFGDGAWDAHVTHIAKDLTVSWQHAWGGTGDDGAASAAPLADGRIAIAGYTGSFGAGARDILFFTIEPVL